MAVDAIDLTDITRMVCESLGLEDLTGMIPCLRHVMESDDQTIIAALRGSLPDANTDWLQKVWQYNFAKRGQMGQDYTPDCLGDLLAGLVGDTGTCLDLCAGSGSLTIRHHLRYPSTKYVCVELDNDVVPVLTVNMAMRRIDAVIVNGDAISGQPPKEVWTVKDGHIMRGGEPFKCDGTISNPPYNIRWKQPDLAPMWPQYSGFDIPPESNANMAFLLTGISEAARAAYILPNGVLSSGKAEGRIRQQLVDANLVEAVISLPERMFESTSIPVCVLLLAKNRQTRRIALIDATSRCESEVRDQRGQFGSKSHTGRVYHKTVNVLTGETVSGIMREISQADDTDMVRHIDQEHLDDDCNLTPKRYLTKPLEPDATPHRPFQKIVDSINEVADRRNSLLLTVNATTARMLGVDEVKRMQDEGNAIREQMEAALNSIEGMEPVKLKRGEYIRFSKNKNEVRFENNSKERVSDVLLLIMQGWKQNIYACNNDENRYLAELRDALLPDLIGGKLQFKGE